MPAECLDLTLNRQISQIPGVLGQKSTFRRCRSMVLPSRWSNKDVSNGFEAFFYPESPVRTVEASKFDQGDPKNCTNGKIRATFPLKKSGRRRTARANVPWKRAHCESSVLRNGTHCKSGTAQKASHCKNKRTARASALRRAAQAKGGVVQKVPHCGNERTARANALREQRAV